MPAHLGRLLFPLALAAMAALPAMGEDLPKPTGEVILTVSGAIQATNDGDKASFDLDMLRGLGEVTIQTTTPWTEGMHSFTGVTLHALVNRLGVTSGTMNAAAINDYVVEIPVSDAVADGPILAYAMDDKEMSVREKGPLWVIYPYDAKKEYQAEAIYSRSIWQLTNIEVLAE